MASGRASRGFSDNVDGVLVLSYRCTDGRSNRAYMQGFHSGIIEAVDSSFLMGEGTAQSPLPPHLHAHGGHDRPLFAHLPAIAASLRCRAAICRVGKFDRG
jgi:hypothetical protein